MHLIDVSDALSFRIAAIFEMPSAVYVPPPKEVTPHSLLLFKLPEDGRCFHGPLLAYGPRKDQLPFTLQSHLPFTLQPQLPFTLQSLT